MADPRVDIWDVLHDGEITIVHRQSTDALVMFVSIPYVRRRIEPMGDSFRLQLSGFREMLFSYDHGGETHSELDYVEGFEILESKSDTMPATIQLAEGTLMLDFDSLDINEANGPTAVQRQNLCHNTLPWLISFSLDEPAHRCR